MSKKHKRSARPTHSKIPSLKGKEQIAESHHHRTHKGKTYYARQTGGAKPFKSSKPRHGGTGRPSSRPQPITPVENKGNKQWLTISKQDFESAGRPSLSKRKNGKLYFKGTGREPVPKTNEPVTYTKEQFEQAGKHRKRSRSNYEKKQKHYLEIKRQEQERKEKQAHQSEETGEENLRPSQEPPIEPADTLTVQVEGLTEEPTEEPVEEVTEEPSEAPTNWEEERRRLDEAQRRMAELEPDTTPDIGSITLDKVYSMIDDTIKSGYGWAGKYLKQMLDETISIWGRDAVAKAIGQFPQEFLAEAETIVQDSDGNRVEVALTKLQMIIEGAIPTADENKALMNEADKDAQYNAPV